MQNSSDLDKNLKSMYEIIDLLEFDRNLILDKAKIEYIKIERIYHSLMGTVYKILGYVKDFYQRMHNIQ